MDIGYQVPDYSGGELASPSDGKDRPKKTVYPGLTLRGDAAKAICTKCDVGEEFTATVKVRVVSVTDRAASRQEYSGQEGANVELDIISMDAPQLTKGAAKEESAEDAIEDFRANKAAGRKAAEDEEME